MAKNLYTPLFLLTLLLGSHAQTTFTPGAHQVCRSQNDDFSGNSYPTTTSASSHPNIIQITFTYAAASSDQACYNFCTMTTAPSGSTLTLMYREGTSSCRCYFTQPVDGVEWTTDGNIPLEYSSSGGQRTLIVCPSSKSFEDNTRCHGDSFDNIPSLNSCFTKCKQTEGCKAYSWRAATDHCMACDSSDRTSDVNGNNQDYSTHRVTVTPVCDGLPGGNGAHGEWRWISTNWDYSSHPQGLYQDEVNFQCDDGYTLGGSGSSKFECNWDGSWVPQVDAQGLTMDAVTCEPKQCTLEVGLGVTTDCGDSFSYLESCTTSCSEGYIGNTATLSCILDDNNDAVIEGSLASCVAETCPVPLDSYTGVESDCGADLDVYQSCAMSCAPYYMPTDFLYVGEGFCRPEGCIIDANGCVVNGYKKEWLSGEECRAQCEADAECVGYAIADIDYNNRCFVHTSNPDSIVPPDWVDFNTDYFDIYVTNGWQGVHCYKIFDPENYELTCNWENGAPVLGQPVECVCQEPLMDFASPTLISNAESAILENSQINIHIQYPQYLNDVVLKFDTLDGDVAYDSNEASNEGWTLSAEDCSQVLERQFAFSELQEYAEVSVDINELTFSLYFSSTETFPHPTEGFPVTRTVVKPLTFTLELATSIELTLDIALHSEMESIVAVEFNYFWADLAAQGYSNAEIIASVEADLAAQGINVEVLSVQSEDILGGFRRVLTADDAHVVIAFGGSAEEMAALLDALENQSFGFNIVEDAIMLNTVDYTQMVSVTSEYSDVVNADGSSTATIHFSTAINEPWEFTGVYTMEDFSGTAHALQEISEENSCKQEGELICEQQWTLLIEISAEDVCATAEHSFTVNMQSAHGDEVIEDAHVAFDFSVLPNQDQCEQITNLGEASNVEGVVQVWNNAAEVFEENPSFEIFLDDVLTFQTVVTSELGAVSAITLSNVKATQVEDEEVCADCLTEFPDEFYFTCSTCDNSNAVDGNQMDFTMRLSGDVFTGYSGDSGKPTQLTFTFDLAYVQGAQRRLLAIVDTGSRRRSLATANASGDNTHVSSINFGLRAASARDTGVFFTQKMTMHLLAVIVVCLLLLISAVAFRRQLTDREKSENKAVEYKAVVEFSL